MKIDTLAMSEQSFIFYLQVNNSNNFGLPILGTDFTALFNGAEVASGSADQAITVAANSTAEFPVLVTTNLLQSAVDFANGRQFNIADFDYELQGKLKVKIAGSAIGVPYKVSGNILSGSKD